MSIPDNLIARYYQLAAFATSESAERMNTQLVSGELHPRSAKVSVAMKIVERYHGADAAQAAFDEFERMFVKKDMPDEIEEKVLSIPSSSGIVDVLVAAGLAPSKSEARRLILGGGVSVDGEKLSDVNAFIDISVQRLLKVGKRRWMKVIGS
jgi:tyrosyl-tRNA synthetase